MTTSKVYDASSVNRDLESELYRLRNQANLSWKKEARNLMQFGLRDEMSILELGSGPGFVTELLSDLVPNGLITAVEIDPVLIKHAEQYLKDKARSQYHIVETSIMNMKFPNNTFDFAVARLVIQFLPDPIGAAKEILRVLKPGGKLVISDQDWDISPVTDPVIPESKLILEKAKLAHMALGGNPMLGRQLWRILKAAGFEKLDLEAVVFHSGNEGIEACYPQIDPDRVLGLVNMNLISQDDMESFRAGIERFMSSENAFFLKIILMAFGEKP